MKASCRPSLTGARTNHARQRTRMLMMKHVFMQLQRSGGRSLMDARANHARQHIRMIMLMKYVFIKFRRREARKIRRRHTQLHTARQLCHLILLHLMRKMTPEQWLEWCNAAPTFSQGKWQPLMKILAWKETEKPCPPGMRDVELRPLMESELAKVTEIHQLGDSEESVAEVHGIRITSKHMLKLRPAEWLNDDIIDFFFALLGRENNELVIKNSVDGLPRCFFFASKFYTLLAETVRIYDGSGYAHLYQVTQITPYWIQRQLTNLPHASLTGTTMRTSDDIPKK